MRFLVIGNPENRRYQFFTQACERLGLDAPKIVSWSDLLNHKERLDLNFCDAVRVESTGENYDVYAALVQRGGGAPISRGEYECGRIAGGKEWYSGWCSVLGEIDKQLTCDVPVLNHPADIALMFDKLRCQEYLSSRNVAVPKMIGQASSGQEVMELMELSNRGRVFVKARHSSSASGVVALQRSGNRVSATTSVRMRNGYLYNSLKMQHYRSHDEVMGLLDVLCKEQVFVEQWFPKYMSEGRVLDFRVLIVRGEPAHIVARESLSPITNLHLGNQRGDLNRLKESLMSSTWQRMLETASVAAQQFVRSHYVAVDIMVGLDGEQVAVAEVNAFGDLLPNLLFNGMTTYEWELSQWLP